jgi:hypothetical protein
MPRILLFFILAILFSGCERPIPNPETMDPIYQDVESKLKEAEGNVASALADVESAKKDLASAQPQTADRKRALEALAKAEHQVTMANQSKLYYEIRKEHRAKEDQKSYIEAFKHKKPWPDPKWQQELQVARRLQSASRKWDDRVPKSREVLAKNPNLAKSPPKKEEGHGGGEEHE